jgi:hypothetical protein
MKIDRISHGFLEDREGPPEWLPGTGSRLQSAGESPTPTIFRHRATFGGDNSSGVKGDREKRADRAGSLGHLSQ